MLIALMLPILGLRTGMPSIKVVPQGDSSRLGYEQVSAAFGPGAPGLLQVTAPAAEAKQVANQLGDEPGVASSTPSSSASCCSRSCCA